MHANLSASAADGMPQGTVLAVGDGRLTLAIDSACARCGHGNACGIGRLAAGRRTQIDIARIDTASIAHLRAGDRVCLAAPENALVAPLLGYVLPAFAMLAGAGMGQDAGGDLFAVFGAGMGFAAALLLTRYCARRMPALARIKLAPGFPSRMEHHHEH
ncbi:MAG: SoxR reducing system RseC family protein [Zoogloeaceae bacterium]|jgi:positive regulator of sigma E activity|nr:SoxR reducing system RseC family protein [Zoogloeaceae bacterium]